MKLPREAWLKRIKTGQREREGERERGKEREEERDKASQTKG